LLVPGKLVKLREDIGLFLLDVVTHGLHQLLEGPVVPVSIKVTVHKAGHECVGLGVLLLAVGDVLGRISLLAQYRVHL